MGYLNNISVTVDAILTKKGRELLARNDGSFRITQFSLADDEIDYTLYNSNHPSGSAFYGEAIENMQIIEAFPDDNNIMVSKLVTLPRGTTKMPVVTANVSKIQLSLGSIQSRERIAPPICFGWRCMALASGRSVSQTVLISYSFTNF